MNIKLIKQTLNDNGYCIIPNILSIDEVNTSKQLFFNWKKTIKNHDYIHNAISPHGIYKFHEIGHQEHSWYIRTLPQIMNLYKSLWDCDELIVSFDGTCYIPQELSKKDNVWTHTDQSPKKTGFHCYQGFVSLTNNKERTLVVYEKSHLLHEKYFKDRNIMSSNNWQLIDHDFLDTIKNSKKILEVPSGSLVLWDSRTFHQNQYGKPNSEERLVQYLCYFPKNHSKNTLSEQKKRKRYFLNRRTTTHWPCPIKVNALQPNTFGDKLKEINYENLNKPNLEPYMSDIKTLL